MRILQTHDFWAEGEARDSVRAGKVETLAPELLSCPASGRPPHLEGEAADLLASSIGPQIFASGWGNGIVGKLPHVRLAG